MTFALLLAAAVFGMWAMAETLHRPHNWGRCMVASIAFAVAAIATAAQLHLL